IERPNSAIDLAAKRVTRDGAEIRLTPTEWHVVEVLVHNRGKLVTQRQLLQEVWGPQYKDETNYLRVFMAQVRRKLEPSRHSRGISSPNPGWATASKCRNRREKSADGLEQRVDGAAITAQLCNELEPQVETDNSGGQVVRTNDAGDRGVAEHAADGVFRQRDPRFDAL